MNTCDTCRYWLMHSLALEAGDCMHKSGDVPHRYSRMAMPDGTVAHLDSFGPQVTGPRDTCGAHEAGEEH
jgi:hypothetical protein